MHWGMVRKRDVEGAVPYAKLYVCRGDHWSPDEKQIIDKREWRKEPPHRRLRRRLPLKVRAIGRPMVAPTEIRGALGYGTKKGMSRAPFRTQNFMFVGAIIGRQSGR